MSTNQNKISSSEKINDKMQNQIFSMLKGVGFIDDKELELHENLEDIKENLFGDDDFSVDFDDAETNHNTTMSQNTFLRPQIEKSLTTKMDNIFFKNYNELSRRRRFPTQNYFSNYSFNPIKQNINLNDSFSYQLHPNCFLFNNINNNINNINHNNYEHPFNLNQLFPNNISNIPITTTPLGKKMPIRTFNFKTKQNNKNSNLSSIIKNNINKNIKSSFFHQIHKNNNIQDKSQSNFFINENTPRELEGILVQQGGFSYNVYHLLKGKFIPLMKTQQTSRILQFYLDQTNEDIIHLIFLEISNDIEELILDIYANYFCLKLFYFLNKDDRMIFLNNISHKFDYLSINKISTYPIQCIIEKLNTEEEFDLVFNSVKNNLMKLSFDVYGTHVLEKIISTFNYEKHLIHISKFIIDNFISLVNNSNGLCIVKKEIILEYQRKKGEIFQKLKKLLLDNSLILIQNPFGNYALQMAIDNWDLKDVKEIIESFKGKGHFLSIQKYSSNVIERCIEKDEEFLINFIYEISLDNKTIGILMKNNYGNYVIQTALKVSKNNKNIQMILINSLNKNLITLNDKKLINKWKNIISINNGK